MKRRMYAIFLLGILLITAVSLTGILVWQRTLPVQTITTTAVSLPTPPVVHASEIDTLLPPDSIRAIDDPQFVEADQAQDMEPDERIIGLIINGDARAYPLAILSSHEIVNDIVGSEPVAVTWCPLCYSALVFSRGVDGRILTFEPYPGDSTLLRDMETGSSWIGATGQARDGQYRLSRLAPLIATPAFEFGWTSYFPQSDTYGHSP